MLKKRMTIDCGCVIHQISDTQCRILTKCKVHASAHTARSILCEILDKAQSTPENTVTLNKGNRSVISRIEEVVCHLR